VNLAQIHEHLQRERNAIDTIIADLAKLQIGQLAVFSWDSQADDGRPEPQHVLLMRYDHTVLQTLVDCVGKRIDDKWAFKPIDAREWTPDGCVSPLSRQDGDICHVLATHGLPDEALKYAIQRVVMCDTTVPRAPEPLKASGSLTS